MKILANLSMLFLTISALPLLAGSTVQVAGHAMYPSKDIIENAMKSADYSTLVAAVKATGLVDTSKGAGPFTVLP